VTSSAPRPETRGPVEWSVASAPLPGEARSGDQSVVREFAGGVLIGAVDGLGHGDAAALAASRAVQILGEYSGTSLVALMRQCHAALAGTRGVVMSLAWFNVLKNTMTWVGVGNVEGVLRRDQPASRPPVERLVPAGGVVGYQLPSLRPAMADVLPGDVLVLATDGIRSEFVEAVTTRESPARLATQLMSRFSRPTDDALVLVARYLGGLPQ
jgi:phosphoserine phosphatase RsbX